MSIIVLPAKFRQDEMPRTAGAYAEGTGALAYILVRSRKRMETICSQKGAELPKTS